MDTTPEYGSSSQEVVRSAPSEESVATSPKFFSKPDNCTALLKSIDYSSFCLAKQEVTFNEHASTTKACAIDLSSSLLNGGELDVNFYYEQDPTAMDHFKLMTEIHKKAIPGSTFQLIEELGDESFLVQHRIEELKVLVLRMNNVRVMIHAQLHRKKKHCMYGDQQLINMAKAIAERISSNEF